MPFSLRTVCAICGFVGLLALSVAWADETVDDNELPTAVETPVDYLRDVQPLLEQHCYDCHNADLQEGGLRLDSRRRALEGGDSGAAIKPGDSATSRLILLSAGLDEELEIMPPDGEGDPLSREEVAMLRAWIDQGAVWPEGHDGPVAGANHWAYQPIVQPPLPTVNQDDWLRNAIDSFVLARLEKEGIDPSPEADRTTLIRRLYYDLLGLPPTPAEVDAFVADQQADAYEQLVDRILESPHFGERWGRHWLDLARYADSNGYEKDNNRPNAWKYRDWVIDAMNADMPFDQFTIEQLAGDQLDGATEQQRLATAFHRQTLTNTEGGVDAEEFRVVATVDRTNTTGSVWLGLTVGCAQCHSHKYDAFSQREYYQLYSFFNRANETQTRVPISEEAVALYQEELAVHQRRTAELEAEFDTLRQRWIASMPAWEEKIQSQLAQPAQEEFHPLEIVRIESQNEVQFERQDDGSLLVTGPNPATNKYTITARTTKTDISGIRIEVLADERLPAHGPGRVSHGNFVLSELRLYAAATDDLKTEHAVPLMAAEADHSQNDWPVAHAIDGELDTGWAVASQFGKDHWALFRTQQSIGFPGETWLQIVLDQQHGNYHTIGRLRVILRTGDSPLSLPDEVKTILAIAPEERTEAEQAKLLDHYLSVHSESAALEAQLEEHRTTAPAEPMINIRIMGQGNRTTHLLHRGDFRSPGIELSGNTPESLPPITSRHEDGQPDRLDLARWLVDPAHPLTPRVTANRIWSHLFGQGLVRSLGNFGAMGDPPSHPMLLDWLAFEFRDNGWSRKQLIRTIVTSATYRQSSNHRPELIEKDPLNMLLYRQNRFRVEAEIVRDIALAASGLMENRVGGPSVFPPMPPEIAALTYANSFRWTTSTGADRYRRGMYTFFKRTAPHPNLMTFDCPDSNTSNLRRNISNTPLGALSLLNNIDFVECSQSLAVRAVSETPANDVDRLTHAFRLCVARPPTDAELAALAELLSTSRHWYEGHATEASQMIRLHSAEGVPAAEMAAWVATVRVILNMDEFVTRD